MEYKLVNRLNITSTGTLDSKRICIHKNIYTYNNNTNNNKGGKKIMTIYYVIFKIIIVFKAINTYSASIFKEQRLLNTEWIC